MKLQNKETEEIGYLQNDIFVKRIRVVNANNDTIGEYNSLAELNEEWEDYEEPKEYWYIENNGDIDKEIYDGDNYEERMIEIGNYFDTLEEADKAVEKLKAWKRLKDKGFRFKTVHRNPQGSYNIYANFEGHIPPTPNDINVDLNTCFGGEE